MPAFEGLKWFRYDWNEQSLQSASDIGLAGLLDNLLVQKETLETIILDTRRYGYFTCPWEVVQPVGSFEQFSRLKILEISTPLLIGSSIGTVDDLDSDDEMDVSQVSKQPDRETARTGSRGLNADGQANRRPNTVNDVLENLFPPDLEVLRIHAPDDDFANRVLTWLIKFIPHVKHRLPRLRSLDLTDFKLLTSSTAASAELINSLLEVVEGQRVALGTIVRLPSDV
jgi:hypothetical protein